jgi:endonuclease/exonuclease/phosphatase family metal-dependent hydrolase
MDHYRRDIFRIAEAALVGLFFVQTIRFLYGTLYAHIGSANLVSLTADLDSIAGMPGVIDPATVQTELVIAGVALFVPLLSVVFRRLWFGPALAAIVVAAGRVFMTANGTTVLGVIGAVVAASAAALYVATIAIQRPGFVPVCFVLGFSGDQLIRLYGSTVDVTWGADFLPVQTVVSLALFAIAALAAIFERMAATTEEGATQAAQHGEISGWCAFAMGGLLYLEFAVLGLPNTVAHRAGVDYISVAPWLTVATLLPLVAPVRDLARRFLGMFDGQYRGWVWFLMIGLLLIIGFRFTGPLSAVALIAAQLLISLSWWWIIQPSDGRRNFTGPGVVFAMLLFLALTGADFLTYEYAFVRGVIEPFGSMLRAFRGLGWAVTLFATLLIGLPAILARKRLPWRGGRLTETLVALALVVMAGVFSGSLAQPVVANAPGTTEQLRIATLNLHGGYSLYFGSDLEEIKQQILAYGVDVLLLQEVEAGRLVSYGVDQPAWLARQLNMQVDYFPTNEGMQGLAILTRLPIEARQGLMLSSHGKQTGVQFVRLRAPDRAELHVYNTELGYLLKESDLSTEAQEQDQVQQIQEIFGFINQNDPSLTSRTVVGGTFNNTPGSDIYQYMAQSSFTDPLAGRQAEKAVTLKLVNGRTERVDYLWLRHITSRSADVASIPQSTHNMPVVEIGLLQTTG